MKVKDILKDKGAKVVTISPEKSIYDAVKTLVQKNIGSLLVMDEKGGIAGIITERDVLRECERRFQELDQTKVKDVMTKDLIVASPDDDLDYVENIMTQNRVRHLPIIANKKLEGIISIGDIVNVMRGECTVENRYLKDYISGKYPG
ncbi:MAG: CBS domain-containing protein [candidate division Zixibacteria bacterium]|nr:CBS domain-containing protein [candidate division Zixibacteria bacterium]